METGAVGELPTDCMLINFGRGVLLSTGPVNKRRLFSKSVKQQQSVGSYCQFSLCTSLPLARNR